MVFEDIIEFRLERLEFLSNRFNNCKSSIIGLLLRIKMNSNERSCTESHLLLGSEMKTSTIFQISFSMKGLSILFDHKNLQAQGY